MGLLSKIVFLCSVMAAGAVASAQDMNVCYPEVRKIQRALKHDASFRLRANDDLLKASEEVIRLCSQTIKNQENLQLLTTLLTRCDASYKDKSEKSEDALFNAFCKLDGVLYVKALKEELETYSMTILVEPVGSYKDDYRKDVYRKNQE